MVYAVPLGSCQWLPLRPVPVYADSGKSTQSEGKAPLPSLASLGGGMWVIEIKVGCVDSHCNLLGQCEVSKQSPTRTDCFVAGATEVKGGGSRVVCLHVAFPLELRVS